MRRYFLLFLLLLLAGCNLATTGQPTLEPTPTLYVAPTPYIAPTQVTLGQASDGNFGAEGVSGQMIVITPTTQNLLTPVPAQTLIQNPQPSPTSQNAIEAFVNNLIIPIWNFFYTFILDGLATLWLFAGARGGFFAQFFCCIVPFFVVIAIVLIRLRVVRWRRH